MAITNQVLKSHQVRGKKSKKTPLTRAQALRQTTSCKGGQKDGPEELRQAVNRQIGRNVEKLAKVLMEKALKGDLATTRVMVELAEGRKPEPDSRPSVALMLAAEPQWEGPPLYFDHYKDDDNDNSDPAIKPRTMVTIITDDSSQRS